MGIVYKVKQLDANRIIALKLLHTLELSDEENIKRFHREAKALSRLQHVNIVNFLHFGFSDEGVPFAALEYLPGKTLAALINEEKNFSPARAIRIMKQVGDALAFSHDLGIIHRDLKPANIILLAEPEPDFVKVVDFGLAKLVDVQESAKLTYTGLLMGSIHYMSPEQAQGKQVDGRSDIYACGCILFEMLCGEKPFNSDNPINLLYMQSNDQVPPFFSTKFGKHCPPALEAICSKAMEKDAANRYQSMKELLSDLEVVKSNSGRLIASAGVSAKPRHTLAKSRVIRGLLLSVSCLLAMFGAFVFLRGQQTQHAASQLVLNSSSSRRLVKERQRELQRQINNVAFLKQKLDKATNADERNSRTIDLFNSLCSLGRVATDLGELNDAEHSLTQAYTLCDSLNDAEIREARRVRVLILRGLCRMEAEKLNESHDDFNQALAIASKLWGENSVAWQDVFMQSLILNAHEGSYAQVEQGFDRLEKRWLHSPETNPKYLISRIQKVDPTGPARLELIWKAFEQLRKSNPKSTQAKIARLKAVIKAARTVDRSRTKDCVYLAVALSAKIPESESELSNLRAQIRLLEAELKQPEAVKWTY